MFDGTSWNLLTNADKKAAEGEEKQKAEYVTKSDLKEQMNQIAKEIKDDVTRDVISMQKRKKMIF